MSWAFWNWAQFWLVWVCRIFLESQHRQKYHFWGQMCVWPVDWNWSGPKTNPYVKFLLVLCLCWWCGQTGGGAFERVQIFILAEGLKIEFLGLMRQRKQFDTNSLQILCTVRHHPSVRPRDSEICDSRLSYLKPSNSVSSLLWYFNLFFSLFHTYEWIGDSHCGMNKLHADSVSFYTTPL